MTAGPAGLVRSERLTACNARKIHSLGAGWWMTGTGLSAYLQAVQEQVRRNVEEAPTHEPAVARMRHLVQDPNWFKKLYEDVLGALLRDMPAGVEKPEVLGHRQEIVFAGFDAQSQPVVMRTAGVGDFAFQCRIGAGSLGFSGEDGAYGPEVAEEIRAFLLRLLADLSERPLSHIGSRAWDLLPRLFVWMARAFPEKLSATGDLVVLTPTGHQWFIF